jgi:TRAP-type mannitol/chloroaromatic compound transport system permease small subunit
MSLAKNKIENKQIKNKSKILIIAATVMFLIFFIAINIYFSVNYLTVEKKIKRFEMEEPYIY